MKSIYSTFLAVLLLFLCNSGTGFAADAASAADSAFSQMNSRLGSSGSFRENASLPMTSSQTGMQSLDGQTSFDAQLISPSSAVFLTLSASPGPTGDLASVKVVQDSDFDSVADWEYVVPFPVSGVCANGVVSCTPGTWTDCSYFEWVADNKPDATPGAKGKVGLAPTNVTSLGGCNCINSDCGSNIVWNDFSSVLRALGGGAVGAAQKVRPDFSVSEAKLENNVIVYYGQHPGGAAMPPGLGSTAEPETLAGYAQAPSAMEAAAGKELLKQQNTEGSLFDLNRKAMENSGTGADAQTCSIERSFSLSEVKVSEEIFRENGVSGNAHIRPCPSGEALCYEFIVGRIGNNYYKPGSCKEYIDSLTILIQKPELIESVRLVHIDADDRVRTMILKDGAETIVRDYPTPYGCSTSSGDGKSFNDDVSAHFKTAGNLEFVTKTTVTDKGEGWARYVLKLDAQALDGAAVTAIPGSIPGALYSVNVETIQCPVGESLLNECQGLEADTDCVLQEETTDGEKTVLNANATGTTPQPETKTFVNGFCSAELSSPGDVPWWKKERTYLCLAQEVFDFSDASERLDVIEQTASFDGSTIEYADKRKDQDNGWIEEVHSASIDLKPAAETCEPACKTRRPAENTQVTATGHVAETRSSIESFDYFYRACLPGNSCPLEPGEELLIDCQCINEFAEAATVLMSLKAAQEDLICSSGVKK